MSIVRAEWHASNNHCAEITEEGWENWLLMGEGISPLLDESVKVVYPPEALIKKGFKKAPYLIEKRKLLNRCSLCEKLNSCDSATLSVKKLYVIHCQTRKQFYFIEVKK